MASLSTTDIRCVVYTIMLVVTVASAEEYRISIKSGETYTVADPVFIKLGGNKGQTGSLQLVNPEGRSDNRFLPHSINKYILNIPDIGDVCSVTIRKQGEAVWWWMLEEVTLQKTKEIGLHEVNFNFHKWMYRIDERTVIKPLKGDWGTWTKWPNCTAACNETLMQFRYRFCNNPRPGCGGADCDGGYQQSKVCHGPVCPTSTTATSTTATTATATTTTATKKSAATTGKGNPERLIILGVLFALSLFLAIFLAIFLIIVLRDKKVERSAKKKEQTSFGQDVEN